MRRALAALAGALLLAGCPIPQAVPDYPPGAVTPPRIVIDNALSQIPFPDTVIRVPIACSPPPHYDLSATLRHSNTIDPIVARWFVNYEPGNLLTVSPEEEQQITEVDPGDPTVRSVSSWTFEPYGYPSYGAVNGGGDNGALHVVELVVSNGFDPDGVPTNRSPKAGFEVQLYRWVFLNGPGSCF